MLLSHKTIIKVNDDYENIIGHMCYAASKLWNVCNYERKNYKDLSLPVEYPDWYYQKKVHKDNIWARSLPAQTAQEVCKQLDKSWKSYYKLVKSKGIVNPKPPRYKQTSMAITYMQKGILHDEGSETIRLSLPKQLKIFMFENYDIHANYLYLKNNLFKNMNIIKQIKIYPPEHGNCKVIVIYEIPDVIAFPDNDRYLSIDLGVHNFMTCYDSANNKSFIVGRKYMSIRRYYDKEIARVQSQWCSIQAKKGIKYPKGSKHITRLYEKKNNTILDYLHKITKYIAEYCSICNIHTVIIGDITGIRNGKDIGDTGNQNFHGLPYKNLTDMLCYKLALHGIRLVRVSEAYSSQCSPLAPKVGKSFAAPENRVKRGLYTDKGKMWNADSVGAYNIGRIYLDKNNISALSAWGYLKTDYPEVIKVAV